MAAHADCSFLIVPEGAGSGAASIADWEYDDFSVGSTCSGLSDLASQQSSEPGSPERDVYGGPLPLQSLQSFSSQVSPFAANWGVVEPQQHGLVTRSADSMDWARSGAAAALAAEDEADGLVAKKKTNEAPAAKKARRREQQKVAQQRYRQKQRHWASDAEVKVDELAEQRQEIRAQRAALAARRTTLEDNIGRLKKVLAERSAEIKTLRDRVGASRPAIEEAEAPVAGLAQTVAAAAQRLSDSVTAVRACIQQHHTKQGSCLESMPSRDLQQLLAAYHAADAAQHPASPVKAADEAGYRDFTDQAARAKHQDALVKALRLTPVQRKTLAWIRERQLCKIATLRESRRELSLRTMSQMLPLLRLTAADLEEQLGGPALTGGLAASREAVELDATIDVIKANIADEAQAAAELEDVVMHRALTPLQAAVFVVESFPGRPDSFALVDSIASTHGSDKTVAVSTGA